MIHMHEPEGKNEFISLQYIREGPSIHIQFIDPLVCR